MRAIRKCATERYFFPRLEYIYYHHRATLYSVYCEMMMIINKKNNIIMPINLLFIRVPWLSFKTWVNSCICMYINIRVSHRIYSFICLFICVWIKLKWNELCGDVSNWIGIVCGALWANIKWEWDIHTASIEWLAKNRIYTYFYILLVHDAYFFSSFE